VTLLRPARFFGGIAVAAMVALSACSDNGTGSGGDDVEDEVQGIWVATSFAIGETDYVPQGMAIVGTLTATTYSLGIINDVAGICDGGGANCTLEDNYSVTSTAITLDPGGEDEVVFTLSLQGNTMTWSGVIDGETLTIGWTRVT
jgi:hypothetical protein